MRVLFILCALFCSSAAMAQSLQSLVLTEPSRPMPISVRLEREEVDRYLAEAYVLSSGGLSITGGLSRQWKIPLVEDGKAAVFEMGYQGHVECELRAYPVGTYALGGWEESLPEYLAAAAQNPANSMVRFKSNEDGSVQFMLSKETRGREILGPEGQVIFSDKREVYPTLWGSPYYLVEYTVTQNPDTEDEVELVVNELFLSIHKLDLHLIFCAPAEYHSRQFQLLLGYLKNFYVSERK
ncbi:hypothetical protein SH580_10675 [Coraliomargarita algicola]|uniref:Uncharacterized protein n=1 Tax=Coraliomargarita algicola TaxID=3092156 RepID=A0ABZ0RS61_9BACT|nr:hypothetical protein [Coraliomargarita sp. J2-16]WPJ98163.1 hypothetical protein SH580_10675 [Coraliomargarita sp. J2-16]